MSKQSIPPRPTYQSPLKRIHIGILVFGFLGSGEFRYDFYTLHFVLWLRLACPLALAFAPTLLG